MSTQPEEQSFGPTSGVVTGWLGIALAVLAAGAIALGERTASALGSAALVLAAGVLVWCFTLRPRVRIRPPVLVLRNAFSDWHIPLAAIDDVLVRQATAVEAGDRTYIGIGVGHSIRKLVRRDRRAGKGEPKSSSESTRRDRVAGDQLPVFMTEQILSQVAAARGVGAGSAPGGIERAPAVPELVAIGVLLLLFAVLTLV